MSDWCLIDVDSMVFAIWIDNFSWARSLLRLGNGWVITTQRFMWIWLLIPAMLVYLVCVNKMESYGSGYYSHAGPPCLALMKVLPITLFTTTLLDLKLFQVSCWNNKWTRLVRYYEDLWTNHGNPSMPTTGDCCYVYFQGQHNNTMIENSIKTT